MPYSFTGDLMGGLDSVMAGYPALQAAMTGGIQPQQVPVNPPFAIPELNTPEAMTAMGVGNPYANINVPTVAGPGDVPLQETPGYGALPEAPTAISAPDASEDLWGFLSSPQMQLAALAMGTGMMGGQDIGTAFQAGMGAYQSYEDRKNAQAQQKFSNEMSKAQLGTQQVSGEKDRALRKRGQDIDLESLEFRAKDATADREFRKELASADATLRIDMQAEDARNKAVLEAAKAAKDTGQFNDASWKQAINLAKAEAGINPETLEPNPVTAARVMQIYNGMTPDSQFYLTANSKDVTSIMDSLGAADGDVAAQQAIIDAAVTVYSPSILPIIDARLEAAEKENKPNPDPMPDGTGQGGVAESRSAMPKPVTAPPAYMMPQTTPPSPGGYPFSFMGG